MIITRLRDSTLQRSMLNELRLGFGLGLGLGSNVGSNRVRVRGSRPVTTRK